jgi:hypothetical protein
MIPMTKRCSTVFFACFRAGVFFLTIFFSLLQQRALACDPTDPVCGENLACNDQVNVTLQDGCSATVTPDMVLEGNLGCLANYQQYFKIRIVGDDPDETGEGFGETTVDACGRFIYEIIFDHEAFCADGRSYKVNFPAEGCWGYINAEDKTAPRFVCEQETIEEVIRTTDVQHYSGVTGDPSVSFGSYSCFREVGVSTAPCRRGYKLIENISSNQPAVYTFYLEMPGASGALAIYEGDFDPDSPCANIVAQSSTTYLGTNTSANGLIRINLPMEPMTGYTILVTTDDAACSSNQPFELYAFSEQSEAELSSFGPFTEKTVAYPLLCGDISAVRNSAALIAPPEVRDNCTTCDPVETWFEDVLTENGDCGGSTITRTWYARDAAGNEAQSCTQTIRFRNVRLEDVVRPPTTVPIECDAVYPKDANGNPHPDFTGYPFVVTAAGVVDLNDSYCNVGASYRDLARIDVCEGVYKIVREWTIIDWCDIPDQNDLNNSSLINYRQVIKIGDFSGPQISNTPGEGLVFPTGPFSCEAAINVPPVNVVDNCSNYAVESEIFLSVKQPIYDKYGNLIDEEYEYVFFKKTSANGFVSGVPINDPGYPHMIVYHAEDGCGNRSQAEVFFEVKDEISPIAVCNDDLTISVGGEGIGRITADDLDEGSWDNCVLDTILISRKLIDDDRRDAYLSQVYNLSFADLEIGAVEDLSGRDREVWVLKSDPERPILLFDDDMWFTWWSYDVWFICEDMQESVTIDLLVRDISGNVNTCWLEVFIEDKIAPLCMAPAEIRMACTELPYGFDPQDDAQLATLFGEAAAQDNCPNPTVKQVRKTVTGWECNSGLITRYFQAADAKGRLSINECKQTVEIYRVHNYELRFPKDAEEECAVPSPDTIHTAAIGCDLLSVNAIDEPFTASGEACYKIRRTYQVINWCEYDGESEPVVVGRNEDCDTQVGEEDVYVLVRPNDVTYYDVDNDENNTPANSPCNNGAEGHLTNSLINEDIVSNGYWQYSQFIKIYDRRSPEITFTGETEFCSLDSDCETSVAVPMTIEDVCAADDLTIKVFLLPDPSAGLATRLDLQVAANADLVNFVLSGDYPGYSMTARLPLGDHVFEVHAADGCGNTALETFEVSVYDCLAPSPICINGLAIELMPLEDNTDADEDGDIDAAAATIWATDFRLSGLDDCSSPVILSINRVGETPRIDQPGLTLTCDDRDTVMVEIYAWDGAYNPEAVQPDGAVGGPNYDHCVTYVLVQDNMFDLCDPANPASIGGLIVTSESETVENVEVRLSGDRETTLTTSVDGFYMFNALEAGSDYTVTPIKDDDYINGVSTFDLVLITKHILGTGRFANPYQMIAADANRSRRITALDLIQLRKLILSITKTLNNNTSWRFIPASYRFPAGDDPWAEEFPEVMNFNDLQNGVATGDFIAIKTGDVNNSAIPNTLAAQERTTAGVFPVLVDDQKVQRGKEYRVAFRAPDLEAIQGYQFTLRHEGLELVDIEYGVAKAGHFGEVEDGVLTTSWNVSSSEAEAFSSEAEPFSSEAEPRTSGASKSGDFDDHAAVDHLLFTLVVRATVGGRLSELLSVNSRYTAAEAYNNADEQLAVALVFDTGASPSAAVDLYQNVPNPFREETVIGFTLPEAAEATLKVHDLNGRVLKLIRNQYGAGAQQIRLGRGDLGPTNAAILYYTLETDGFTATRKMVLVD